MSSDTTVTAQPDHQADPEPPRRTRRRLRKVVLVSLLVVALLVGAGAIAATYYVDSVKVPSSLEFPSNTVLYYSDGTVLAELGEVRRTKLRAEVISEVVKQVAVAAEDPDFYSDSGGPIVRSVVRINFDLQETSTSSKLRTAILARKLDDALSKEEILEMFLNSTPFGRLTYGIEAAAHEYFGKTADKRAPREAQLTTAEAIVLLAMVDQPEAAGDDAPGFDPTRGTLAEQNSRRRFDEIRVNMRELEFLTDAQAGALTYPTNTKPYDENARAAMFSQPVGLVVNQVLSELTHSDTPFRDKAYRSIAEGGYEIHTTINPAAQKALEQSVDGRVAGSVMSGQRENLQAAGAMVEPTTGRVLAYYGGDNGTGQDYASVYYDEAGKLQGSGHHAPGSSFMVYTLAAALTAGYSLDSYWEWTPRDMSGRTGEHRVRNASTCPRDRAGACSLLDSVTASLNVPMYAVTLSLGPTEVLRMARDAGIDSMWNDAGERKDLAGTKDLHQLFPSQFDTILGLGQYPVTVLDQANAMATFSAGGHRAQAHFVEKILTDDKVIYGENLPALGNPAVLDEKATAALTSALSQTPAGKLSVGDSAGKTGSWEYQASSSQNSNAWMIGYTSKLALAVWIGDRKGDAAIKDTAGLTIWGSTLPSTIYRNVMNAAHTAMSLKPDAFAPAPNIGAANPPGSVPR